MKLYTRTVCPRCLWIKSELARAGIEAEVVNIERDEEARERLLEAGIKSVPALEIEGRLLADPAEMMEAVEQMRP